MTKFANQSVGSFYDNTHEYVEIWFDATWVKAFKFHSVMVNNFGGYHRIHGVTVDARCIFAAMKAFANVKVMAVRPDGSEFHVTWTMMNDGPNDGMEELHMGNKYGQVVARMRRTGYVQNLTSSLIEV